MSTREYPAYHRAVGRRLRILRTFYGKSVDFLAELLNVSDKTIYAYETGQNLIGGEEAGKLAELYEVSLDYIFRGLINGLPDDLILLDQRARVGHPAEADARPTRGRKPSEASASAPTPQARRYTLHEAAAIPHRNAPPKGH